MGKPTNKDRTFEVFIPTSDDFYPNFPGSTVRVRVTETLRIWKTAAVRTSVWGADDCGFERDEHFDSAKDMRRCFRDRVLEVKRWRAITKEMLILSGFVRA